MTQSISQQDISRFRRTLSLDELNWSYFLSLYKKKMEGGQLRSFRIHEEGRQAGRGETVVYPLDIAPDELLQTVAIAQYDDLFASADRYKSAAKGAALWIKKMQAGSGSSLTRSSYLSKRLGVPESEVQLGAKGTDLYIEVANPRDSSQKLSISIAEAQILQCIEMKSSGEIGEIIVHDIVSSETQESIRKLWSKSYFYDRTMTYSEYFHQTPGLALSGETFQSYVPTLDEKGMMTLDRTAPAGHALFAVDALRLAAFPEMLPDTRRPLIAAISNGEDLSGTPDSVIVGYMLEHRIPIAMIVTERTPVDMKGGLISVMVDESGFPSLTLMETAQAKEAGQAELFSSLNGSINTNMALFNYEVLVPMIESEVKQIGMDAWMQIISPDLIVNQKEQKDKDGIYRKYIQLEGAMGSTLMNLDRYWRKKYGKPILGLIHVDRANRTRFFSPIKSAFDFFMQFHSDRFRLDEKRMRLVDLRPGALPQVQLTDPATRNAYYNDVENVLESFEGCGLRSLDSLNVEGRLIFRDVILSGKVRIVSRSREPVVLAHLFDQSQPVLKNKTLEIDEQGRLGRIAA